MDEKKVNFEVGDYVKIVADNDNRISADCCGRLGIIVGEGYYNDYWKVYLFAPKRICCVEEKFLAKADCDYEIRPKKQERHDDSIDSLAYGLKYKAVLDPVQFLAARGNGKPLTSLKEMYRKYIENDINATKMALNSIYGRHFNSDFLPKIKKVIFNGPATIVLWADGDKTIVQCVEGDTMDKEKGLAMAICKKALGKSKTHYDYYNVFKKWIKEK